MAKFLLLGSGELSKEFAIAAQRLGQHVVAVDKHRNAPAMSVSHSFEVIDMFDGSALDAVVQKHKPDFIVPETEAVQTGRFFDYEKRGIIIVPSAHAINVTMDRKIMRELAAQELGFKTPAYRYATSNEELRKAVDELGMPCMVKPLISPSGKGQRVVKMPQDIDWAWQHACENGRSTNKEVIVEQLIDFKYEITLLTVTQTGHPTFFCAPIGHIHENGGYRESWQPAAMEDKDLAIAKDMAQNITEALGGAGLWSVEFFVAEDGVYFSEVFPRPNDTGLVTLANTQNFNEFELHLRAVLGLPISGITLEKMGASAVILSKQISLNPTYKNVEIPAAMPMTDFRIFGQPTAHEGRRMGVVVSYGDLNGDMSHVRERAFQSAKEVEVTT